MSAIAEAIKKVATGPHLSKDLSLEEATTAMQEILSGEADPVRAAIFFIALRMKRETHEENLGILNAMQAHTTQHTVDVANLCIFADPYNGFNRHCPISVFLPAVLAAAGLPTITQGVYEMGPKFGVTHAQVLEKAGYSLTQSISDAAKAVEREDIGWAYIDQAMASPAVYALQTLRTQMIKRPSLATLEKMLMPLRAKGQTHLAIGFVHKEYPPILGELADAFGFDSAFIARGLEGGIIPTLREPSNNFHLYDGMLSPCTIDPVAAGIEQDTRGVKAEEVTADLTLEQGLAALNGARGAAYDSLVFGAAILLSQFGLVASLMEGANKARHVLDNGLAKQRFQHGIK